MVQKIVLIVAAAMIRYRYDAALSRTIFTIDLLAIQHVDKINLTGLVFATRCHVLVPHFSFYIFSYKYIIALNGEYADVGDKALQYN